MKYEGASSKRKHLTKYTKGIIVPSFIIPKSGMVKIYP